MFNFFNNNNHEQKELELTTEEEKIGIELRNYYHANRLNELDVKNIASLIYRLGEYYPSEFSKLSDYLEIAYQERFQLLMHTDPSIVTPTMRQTIAENIIYHVMLDGFVNIFLSEYDSFVMPLSADQGEEFATSHSDTIEELCEQSYSEALTSVNINGLNHVMRKICTQNLNGFIRFLIMDRTISNVILQRDNINSAPREIHDVIQKAIKSNKNVFIEVLNNMIDTEVGRVGESKSKCLNMLVFEEQ